LPRSISACRSGTDRPGECRRRIWTERPGRIDDHFHLIRFDDEPPTIEAILEKARASVMRYGVRGLVIDPYNEIEHRRPSNMTETEYVSQLLGKVKRFAQHHGVHVWFVAHPAKLQRLNGGERPVPTLYDISGSSNWVNKADLGIVVHRDLDKDPTRAEIHVRRVRFKSVGKIGTVALRWDRSTGRYSEIATQEPHVSRAYRND
jgi:twinkle protein